MNFILETFLIFTITFFVIVKSETYKPDISAGYVPGVSGMPPINVTNCENDEILKDPSLSNALECARTCHVNQKPKTCYYKFVIERYPIDGQACDFCTPNVTNSICANCQCVPGVGLERMALTVNRMIPGPSIQVCAGDYVVIDVQNNMIEEAVTIHWHGVYQLNYQYYDGVPEVTQCPIIFKTTFRYQFEVKNEGTHFWHAHTGLHKMDGIFGSLVVRQAIEEDPNKQYFDTDYASHVVVINDWMNEQSTERFPGRTTGVTGQHPDTLLINGKGRYTYSNGTTTNASFEVITVEANKRHRFRLINSFCTVCPGQLTIEGHNLTVLESDGQPLKPLVVTSIVSFPGERYDFVIETNQTPGAYWIQLRALDQCTPLGVQQLAILQYANASNKTNTSEPSYNNGLPPGIVLNPLDVSCHVPNPTAICINKLKHALPIDKGLTESKMDFQFIIPIGFNAFTGEQNFRPNKYTPYLSPGPNANVAATLNNITFEFSPSPLISQLQDIPPNQICNAENLLPNCNSTSCTCTHVLKVSTNSTVEIILVDMSRVERLTHPFHLHGHSFRVVSMGQPLGPYSSTGNSTPITVDYVKQLEEDKKIRRHCTSPAGKDTLAVPNNGYIVTRFRANNPGYWFYHCHFVYHQDVGMSLVINVGDQDELPPVPPGFPKCGNFKPDICSSKKVIRKHEKGLRLLHRIPRGPVRLLQDLGFPFL